MVMKNVVIISTLLFIIALACIISYSFTGSDAILGIGAAAAGSLGTVLTGLATTTKTFKSIKRPACKLRVRLSYIKFLGWLRGTGKLHE